MKSWEEAEAELSEVLAPFAEKPLNSITVIPLAYVDKGPKYAQEIRKT